MTFLPFRFISQIGMPLSRYAAETLTAGLLLFAVGCEKDVIEPYLLPLPPPGPTFEAILTGIVLDADSVPMGRVRVHITPVSQAGHETMGACVGTLEMQSVRFTDNKGTFSVRFHSLQPDGMCIHAEAFPIIRSGMDRTAVSGVELVLQADTLRSKGLQDTVHIEIVLDRLPPQSGN